MGFANGTRQPTSKSQDVYEPIANKFETVLSGSQPQLEVRFSNLSNNYIRYGKMTMYLSYRQFGIDQVCGSTSRIGKENNAT
ncbi:hypothetical protein PHMEG_00024315 [Phytophthora megakarya]|uniref:Uncharacterized protein n=1 Tax=Phytophthora megakarya TaxID=4795 RepID=A0A225VEC8_9STRA|nr:hypothetical protein PHMEG_00024315 [Phytophthora megakarya]